jgi:hypothetical protein
VLSGIPGVNEGEEEEDGDVEDADFLLLRLILDLGAMVDL